MNIADENIAYCEACNTAMDVTMMQPFTNVECPGCQTHNRVKVDVGSYVLKKRQGLGGMSLVFGAVDKTLGREVAIKILNESYSMDEKRIEQFEQEAKITAAISHPHVVRVYTVGQAFQRFFIAMELVPGDSLEKKMHDNGSLPEKDVLKWGREVCEGLNAANEAGLIHRDIKPGNILFDAEGHVKIVDFGLALVTQGGKAQADEIWATPYYVPPETLDVLEEDFRSDIYALGASLFHALSGKPPFDTESRSTVELKQIKMNLPSLKSAAPWVSDATCEVIDKAMSFNPDDRYGSYAEIIEALHRAEIVLENEGGQPAMSSAERYERRYKGSNNKLYAFMAIGVIAVGGVITALTMGNRDKPKDNDKIEKPKDLGIEGSDDGGAMGNKLSSAIQEGRNALKRKNYEKAATHYIGIATDNRFSINSAMWAGLQVSIINWLDGHPTRAKFGLTYVGERYNKAKERNSIANPAELTERLADFIPVLLKLDRIDSSNTPQVQSEVDAMLVYAAALKNWEEGYISDSVRLFDKVDSYSNQEGIEFSEEFKIYASIISGYKNDAAIMKPFEKVFLPTTDAEINTRRTKLQDARSRIKTKGRAVENIEEWLIQLDIHQNKLVHERKLEAARKAALEASKNPDLADDWNNFYKGLEEDIEASNFRFVSEKLKLRSFKGENTNKKKEHMIYLCEKASGFIGTLSETLSKGTIRSEIKLKNGKVFNSFSGIDTKGVTVSDEGTDLKVLWGDIQTSSVIDLHSVSLSEGDLSEFEKNLRLEQAIAYAWLGGEKDKATTAAKNLAKANPLFKSRWIECMKYLKK